MSLVVSHHTRQVHRSVCAHQKVAFYEGVGHVRVGCDNSSRKAAGRVSAAQALACRDEHIPPLMKKDDAVGWAGVSLDTFEGNGGGEQGKGERGSTKRKRGGGTKREQASKQSKICFMFVSSLISPLIINRQVFRRTCLSWIGC